MSDEVPTDTVPLTDYFHKLMLWIEVGDGDEDSRTIKQLEVTPEQAEGNRLRVDGVLYDVLPCHECDDETCKERTIPPENSTLGTISLSLAEKLGLQWFAEDEGENAEDGKDGKDDGDKYVFKIIAVDLVPVQPE